jgi:hypothetical protein
MLETRSGSFHRYEDVGPILKVDPNCPSSLSSKHAFIATHEVAHIEKLDREHQKAIKDEMTEKKRSECYAREAERLASFERKHKLEQDRLKRLQEDPMCSKRLSGSNPYDIVTMEYHNTPEGKTLEYHDQLVEYRHGIRSAFLAGKNHLGFNCITGEQIVEIRVPKKPEPH